MYECGSIYIPAAWKSVHLRGGSVKVARGDSAGPTAARTSAPRSSGLVKAQTVKNAVIVPVGAKGGFVVKQPDPADRSVAAEGVACYRTFIRGLLDLTDNLVDGEVVPPPRVVRRRRRRPYLVVAADKGTATFSDIANGVAATTASGSATRSPPAARRLRPQGDGHHRPRRVGVGEAALPRARASTSSDEFTVVGIGDMSGDVFGNGMLLSEHLRLVAAFDHRTSSSTPTPDPARRFASGSGCSRCRARLGRLRPSLLSRRRRRLPAHAKSVPCRRRCGASRLPERRRR
jgi:glutamate dehydrogenase